LRIVSSLLSITSLTAVSLKSSTTVTVFILAPYTVIGKGKAIHEFVAPSHLKAPSGLGIGGS